MGLKVNYFYSLTPRQFDNIFKGWEEKRDTEIKERMILTRRLMFAMLAPWSKATENEIWPFIWEAENEAASILPTEDEIEASRKRWEARDKKRAEKESK